jgi:hypothetical protein
MMADASSGELSLTIEGSGEPREQLEIFFQDMGRADAFDSTGGWRVADALPKGSTHAPADEEDGRPEPGRRCAVWTDTGLGLGVRPTVSQVGARLYLIARRDIDTDGDGVPDAREAFIHGTDPHNPDSDGDGMPDGWELVHGLDPILADAHVDADMDGAANADEFRRGTDPRFARHSNVVIYVDARIGDDLRDGLSAVLGANSGPKRTIRAGLSAAIPGDTVVVAEGVYEEEVSVPPEVMLTTRGEVQVQQAPARDRSTQGRRKS